MTWVKLDDRFFDNKKVAQLDGESILLYLSALCWSNDQLTDGRVPKQIVPKLAAKANVNEVVRATRRLLDLGLWERVEPGVVMIHDYLVYQKTREQVLSERQGRQDAGRLGGVRSGEARRDDSKQNRSKTEANASANGKQNGTPYPYPSTDEPTVHLTVMSQPAVGTDEEAASASSRSKPNAAYSASSRSKPNAAYSDPDFLRFWKVWSAFDTRDKLNAWKNWLTRRRQDRIAADDLVRAAENYAADIAARPRELHVIMHASTFLGPGHRYSDYLEPPKVTPIRPGVAPIPNQRRAGRETTQEKLDRAFGRFAAENTGRVAIGGGS